MPGEHVRIVGLKPTMRQLVRLDEKMKVELKAISKAAAEMVKSAIESRVPRLSGRLANSLRIGVAVYRSTVRIGGAAIPYAKPIHFGWPAHNIAPNTFMYEGLDERKEEVVALYKERVHGLVERTMHTELE